MGIASGSVWEIFRILHDEIVIKSRFLGDLVLGFPTLDLLANYIFYFHGDHSWDILGVLPNCSKRDFEVSCHLGF